MMHICIHAYTLEYEVKMKTRFHYTYFSLTFFLTVYEYLSRSELNHLSYSLKCLQSSSLYEFVIIFLTILIWTDDQFNYIFC